MSILRPLRRKDRKPDTPYRKFIKALPCMICVLLGVRQRGRTRFAHLGLRGLGTKCIDREGGPLCDWHHTNGPGSHHKLQKIFWGFYGLDRDELIRTLNDSFDLASSGSNVEPESDAFDQERPLDAGCF